MYIASASTTVKFHEFPNGNVVHNYQPGPRPDGPIKSVSWNKNGNWLVLVPHTGLVEVISIKDRLRLIHTIKNVTNPSCARFPNTTKKYITLGSDDGQVFIYDIKTSSITKTFQRSAFAITHIDITPKDTHIAAGCKNGEVLVYSNITNTLSTTFKVPRSKSVSALKCNPLKRNLLLSSSNEGVVVVWDINSNKSKFVIQSHKAPVTAATFSPINSDVVVSCGLDRQFCFYDIANNKTISEVTVENSLMAVDFSHDGTHIVMASQNGHIYIYDSRSIQQPVYSFQAHATSIKHLHFQPNCNNSNSGSNFNITVDSSVKQMPSNENIRESVGRNSDLFHAYVTAPDNSFKGTASESVNNGDSFMLALGLDNNNTTSDLNKQNESIPDGLPKINEEKLSNYAHSPVLNSMKMSEVKSGCASTPKFSGTHLESASKSQTENSNLSHISPIIVSDGTQKMNTNLTASDIRRITKETVTDAMKTALDEIKTDMKLHTMDTVAQLKFAYVDLRMDMAKQLIQLENQCNLIRDLSSQVAPNTDNYLMEENANLRRRIAFLEDQLANMAVKSQNENQNSLQ